MTPTTLDLLGNYADGVYSCPYVIDEGDDSSFGRRAIVYASGNTETNKFHEFKGTRPRSFVSYPNNVT